MVQIKPWIEIFRETIFQKYGHKLDKVIFRLPEGNESDYYLTGNGGRVVAVLAMTADNKIVLIKQFRPGPMKIVAELSGGGVDPNETEIEAIKREFLEESGYTGDFEFVTESINNAYSGAKYFHFVARNCKKIQESTDVNQDTTETVLMDLTEFREHLRSGQLSDVNTGYLGLDYLGLL